MAGYNGYSMSNNAVAAYDDGLAPASKWVEFLKNFSPVFKGIVARDIIAGADADEWHHTSKQYNRTNFYSRNTLFRDAAKIVAMKQARQLFKKFAVNGKLDIHMPDGSGAVWYTIRDVSGAYDSAERVLDEYRSWRY